MVKLIVGKVAEVPPGTLKEFKLDGRTFAIANLNGTLYAMDGVCEHAGGHLGKGRLIGSSVKCPLHGAEYDMMTGKCVKKPFGSLTRAGDLMTFPVRAEGEDVVVEV